MSSQSYIFNPTELQEGYTGAISVAPVAGSPSYTFAEFA